VFNNEKKKVIVGNIDFGKYNHQLLGLLAKEKLKRIKYQLILLPFHPLK
jgi:hypothetical protein